MGRNEVSKVRAKIRIGNMNNNPFVITGFAAFFVWFLFLAGYVSNIVSLIIHLDSAITILTILRIIGIFVIPLGSVMGIVGWFL